MVVRTREIYHSPNGGCDDPFSSMADARSEPIRRELYSWYTGTLYPPRTQGCHRYYRPQDPSGRPSRAAASQQAGGDTWTVVELKALSASGEALWPEKFDEHDGTGLGSSIPAGTTQEVGSYSCKDLTSCAHRPSLLVR